MIFAIVSAIAEKLPFSSSSENNAIFIELYHCSLIPCMKPSKKSSLEIVVVRLQKC